jgi:hypothetical protein
VPYDDLSAADQEADRLIGDAVWAVAESDAGARAQALTAAARAIVADCRVPRGDYLGDACRWCDNTIDRDGHRPGCPVGVLLPLVEDGA